MAERSAMTRFVIEVCSECNELTCEEPVDPVSVGVVVEDEAAEIIDDLRVKADTYLDVARHWKDKCRAAEAERDRCRDGLDA